jgi:hypothetical protein
LGKSGDGDKECSLPADVIATGRRRDGRGMGQEGPGVLSWGCV